MTLQIILFYSFVFVFGEFVKGSVPEYCAKAASCQNFATSVECHTTKYCQESVWPAEKPTHGWCGNCETEIQKIRQILARGSSNLDVHELTKSICNSASDSISRLDCQYSLNQYARHLLKEWLQFLASNLHPATVCQVLGVCSNLTSSNECTHHTVCIDWSSSVKCNYTSSCIRSVWSKQQFLEDNDSVCLVCKNMVQRAYNLVQKKESPKQLRRVLRASCKLILIEEVLHECLQLADNFLPEFTLMLVARMNPIAICTVSNLCNNAYIDYQLKAADEAIRMPTNPKKVSAPTRDNTLCVLCQYLLHFIQEELAKPKEEQKIEEAMERTCEFMPKSMQSECQLFVVEYGASIISLFSQKIDPSLVCPALKVCPPNVTLEEPLPSASAQTGSLFKFFRSL